MKYLLDTNTASYLIRQDSQNAARKVQSLSTTDKLCISVITEAELLFGLFRIGASQKRFRQLDQFLALISILPWGREEASAYGKLRADLARAGRLLGAMDMMIAAHAIAQQATLVTHDNGFRNVGAVLSLEDWATDL